MTAGTFSIEEIGSYTPVPNTLFNLFQAMDPCELRVVLVICRETFGWHRPMARLSLTTFQRLTGCPRQSVLNGLNAGMERGLIVRHVEGNGYQYGLHLDAAAAMLDVHAVPRHAQRDAAHPPRLATPLPADPQRVLDGAPGHMGGPDDPLSQSHDLTRDSQTVGLDDSPSQSNDLTRDSQTVGPDDRLRQSNDLTTPSQMVGPLLVKPFDQLKRKKKSLKKEKQTPPAPTHARGTGAGAGGGSHPGTATATYLLLRSRGVAAAAEFAHLPFDAVQAFLAHEARDWPPGQITNNLRQHPPLSPWDAPTLAGLAADPPAGAAPALDPLDDPLDDPRPPQAPPSLSELTRIVRTAAHDFGWQGKPWLPGLIREIRVVAGAWPVTAPTTLQLAIEPDSLPHAQAAQAQLQTLIQTIAQLPDPTALTVQVVRTTAPGGRYGVR